MNNQKKEKFNLKKNQQIEYLGQKREKWSKLGKITKFKKQTQTSLV